MYYLMEKHGGTITQANKNVHHSSLPMYEKSWPLHSTPHSDRRELSSRMDDYTRSRARSIITVQTTAHGD